MSSPAKVLRNARQRAGLSQDAIAIVLGCSRGIVAHYERGRVSPQIDVMKRWAAACGQRFRFEIVEADTA